MTQDNAMTDVPLIEPGLSSAYRHGWQRLWKNFFDLLLGFILTLAIIVPISLILVLVIFAFFIDTYWVQQLINYAFNILIYGPLGFGWAYMTLRAARGEKIEISHLFEGFRRYGQSVLAYLLLTIFTSAPTIIASIVVDRLFALGVLFTIAAVILIIVVYCKLAFTPFLLLDKKLGGFEAVKASWKMTDNHAGTVFLIGLLGIPIAIAGVLCFLVGIIPAGMWISMALASLYYAVDSRRGGIPVPSDSLPTPPDTSGPFQPA
jgi:uncharacterized membrane protein